MVPANPPTGTGPFVKKPPGSETHFQPAFVVSLCGEPGGWEVHFPGSLQTDDSLASFWKRTWEEQLADECNDWLSKSSICIFLEICVGALNANCLSVLIYLLCKVSIFLALHQMKLRSLRRNLITSLWHYFREERQSCDKYVIEHSAEWKRPGGKCWCWTEKKARGKLVAGT